MTVRVVIDCDAPGCGATAQRSSDEEWDWGDLSDGRSGWIDTTWRLPEGWIRAAGHGEAPFDDSKDDGFRCPAHHDVPMQP